MAWIKWRQVMKLLIVVVILTCFTAHVKTSCKSSTLNYSLQNNQPRALQKQIAKEKIQTPEPTSKTESFHVIATFTVINYTTKNADKRMKEYLYALNKLLQHNLVKQVYLLAESAQVSDYIQKNIGSHPKLLVKQMKAADQVITLHQFAFTHLQGELVVITQADILLGEGFEKVNKTLLAKNKMMYSISRHEGLCKQKIKDQCVKYTGSHDMFVFVPSGNIPEEGIKLL